MTEYAPLMYAVLSPLSYCFYQEPIGPPETLRVGGNSDEFILPMCKHRGAEITAKCNPKNSGREIDLPTKPFNGRSVKQKMRSILE